MNGDPRPPDKSIQVIPLGTEIRVTNPASALHGRCGLLLAAVWPERPDSPVFLRVVSDPELGEVL